MDNDYLLNNNDIVYADALAAVFILAISVVHDKYKILVVSIVPNNLVPLHKSLIPSGGGNLLTLII